MLPDSLTTQLGGIWRLAIENDVWIWAGLAIAVAAVAIAGARLYRNLWKEDDEDAGRPVLPSLSQLDGGLHDAFDHMEDDEGKRKERELRAKRALDVIGKLEAQRKSRVIAIIHRENLESDHLAINDLEDVLYALNNTPEDRPLDIVLHTLGGWTLAATQIARAIKAHKGRTTAFIPYYAMSAGTFIALACDEIVMSPQACLGPIDPQYGFPAATFVNVSRMKPPEATSDVFLAYADLSKKALLESKEEACELMQGTYSHDGSCAITDELSSGKWTHGRPISVDVARQMGLNINTGMPREVFDLVRAHRVPYKGGASVWFR
jgi:ClpP class serine protease